MTRVVHRLVFPVLAFPVLLAAVGLGCSGAKHAGSDQICETSANCGSQGSECLVGVCVPHTGPRTWAVEIVPAPAAPDAPPDGGSVPLAPAAVTELPEVPIGNDVAQLSAGPSVPLTIGFSYASTAPVPANANVVLTVPPGIPGRPDLRFEGAMEDDGRSVELSVPDVVLARAGAVQLLPWPSETLPPSSFAVARVGDAGELTVGGSVTVRGTLRDAFDRPVPADSFAARAFQEGALVSNSTTVDEMGRFALQLSAAAAAKPVTIGFIPRMNSNLSSDPSFSSDPVTVTPPLTTFDVTLPAYITTPDQFKVDVTTSMDEVLVGLLVRATTDLTPPTPPRPLGTTTFSWEATTGTDGAALLALLPGTGEPRPYNFTVSPPAGSRYATKCATASVGVGGSAATTAVVATTVTLSLRPVVFGMVTNATGKPVGNVVVTATLLAPAEPGCPPAYGAVSATTGLDGKYRLSLDKGSYRLDYDPAPGAPVPRLTEPPPNEPPIEVTGDLSHNVSLPRAEYVEGIVHGPDGAPLPMASVHFYEIRCNGSEDCFGPNRTAPSLRARAQADAAGHFFAVVPGP